MSLKKPSFLSQLLGNSDQHEYFEDDMGRHPSVNEGHEEDGRGRHIRVALPEEDAHGQHGNIPELATDVYQTADDIIVRAFVAGVMGTNLDLSLTREMITISGQRHDEKETNEDDYFLRELYWGAFSRTIMLPEEVDVDLAEASETHGVLTIRLPKINKKRQTKLKVRSR